MRNNTFPIVWINSDIEFKLDVNELSLSLSNEQESLRPTNVTYIMYNIHCIYLLIFYSYNIQR